VGDAEGSSSVGKSTKDAPTSTDTGTALSNTTTVATTPSTHRRSGSPFICDAPGSRFCANSVSPPIGALERLTTTYWATTVNWPAPGRPYTSGWYISVSRVGGSTYVPGVCGLAKYR